MLHEWTESEWEFVNVVHHLPLSWDDHRSRTDWNVSLKARYGGFRDGAEFIRNLNNLLENWTNVIHVVYCKWWLNFLLKYRRESAKSCHWVLFPWGEGWRSIELIIQNNVYPHSDLVCLIKQFETIVYPRAAARRAHHIQASASLSSLWEMSHEQTNKINFLLSSLNSEGFLQLLHRHLRYHTTTPHYRKKREHNGTRRLDPHEYNEDKGKLSSSSGHTIHQGKEREGKRKNFNIKNIPISCLTLIFLS